MARKTKQTLRELAKQDWYPGEESPNIRELQLGALQLVAAQLEDLAKAIGRLDKVEEKLENIDTRLWELKQAVEGGAPAAAAEEAGAEPEPEAAEGPVGKTTRASVQAACLVRGLSSRKGRLRLDMAVDAWMGTNGNRGDPSSAADWRIVAGAARGKVKGFGASRRRALEAWIEKAFGAKG